MVKNMAIEDLKKKLKRKKQPWWKTAKKWVCQECGTVNPMSSDVCSGCDCSLDGFVDDEWLIEEYE